METSNTSEQINILKQFCTKFLPKRGNNRKNSGNEIDYITTTLNLIFIQNFQFNLDRKTILDVFYEMDYLMFDVEKKYIDKDIVWKSAKIFIDVEASTLRDLMRLTKPLPEHTNEDKKERVNELKLRLDEFAREILNHE